MSEDNNANEELERAVHELNEALGRPVLSGCPSTAALIREATRRIKGLPLQTWYDTRTIATLPNARLTPQVVLARTLEKASYGKIKSAWIGIEWATDGSFAYDYSAMPIAAMAMHRIVLERRVALTAFGENNDDTVINPAS